MSTGNNIFIDLVYCFNSFIIPYWMDVPEVISHSCWQVDIWIMSKFLCFWVSLRFNSHTTMFTHLVYSSSYNDWFNLWTFLSTCQEVLYTLVFPIIYIYIKFLNQLCIRHICGFVQFVIISDWFLCLNIHTLRVLPCGSTISQKYSLFFNKQLVE